jgi:hypothetical protein
VFTLKRSSPEAVALMDELTLLFTEERLDQAAFDDVVARALPMRGEHHLLQLLRFFAETENLTLPEDLSAPLVMRPFSTTKKTT